MATPLSTAGNPLTNKQDFNYLKNGRLNLCILRDYILQQLKRCMDQFHTEKSNIPRQFTKDKCVIVDDDIKTLLGHIQILNDIQASDVRIFKDRQHDTSDYKITLFIVRPKAVYMEIIANTIKDELSILKQRLKQVKGATVTKQYGIIFVPRRSRVCEEKLKEKGVRGDIIIDELNLDFLPIDQDLLTMEYNDCFKDLYEKNDTTTTYNMAQGLTTIQNLYGIIPNVYVKGDKAIACYNSMQRLQSEIPDKEKRVPPQIDNLILLDRSVDYLTPMLFPGTYEALIDELFGIKFNRIELPTSILSEDFCKTQKIDSSSEEKLMVRLLSSDALYSEIRYSNMVPVSGKMKERVENKKRLREEWEKKYKDTKTGELQGQKLVEMKEFVQKLRGDQSQTFSTHFELVYYIRQQAKQFLDKYVYNQFKLLFDASLQEAIRTIEEAIAYKENIFHILRYLSVMCFVLNGTLKQKEYDLIKKDIVQTYGLQYLVLIHSLEEVGLLYQQPSAQPTKNSETMFEKLKQDLNLLQMNVNMNEPEDIHYIWNQYAAISIRLIEKIVYGTTGTNNQALNDIMNLLPGKTLVDTQQVPMELKRQRHGSTTSLQSQNKFAINKPTTQMTPSTLQQSKLTMVVFIGGVTYGEIAALRFLSDISDNQNDFIIATTHFINGTTLIKSLVEIAQ